MENVGNRYSFLTAIKYVKRAPDGHSVWEYECECGKKVERKTNDVHRTFKKNTIQSCGCKFGLLIKKHGFFGTRFYKIWGGMKNRCFDKNTPYYKNYGGRGVTVCKKWLEFEGFKKDMYKSYLEHVCEFGEKNTTLDRSNVDGNYKKSNCKWSTNKEQANNKRNTLYIEVNGEIKRSSELAEELGLSISHIHGMVNRGIYAIGQKIS